MFRIRGPEPINASAAASLPRAGRSPLHRERIAKPNPRAGSRARARTQIAVLASLVGIAGFPISAAAEIGARDAERVPGPGSVFASLEQAALAALAYAHLAETPTDRERLRAGTIQRVESGYTYAAPKRSAAPSPTLAPTVRYRLRANDVARYVIPPRSGNARIDRWYEEPTRAEKRIVDELDPRHRPLYQLTPSLDVVRYGRGGESRVVANLNDFAQPKLAAAASAAEGEPDLERGLCPMRPVAVFARSIFTPRARGVD